jgi:sulfonate transport system substrate-binding protein
LSLVISLAIAACSPDTPTATSPASPDAASPSGQAQALRIGYQKGAVLLNLTKSRGTLEKRLQPEGVSVSWSEFVAGPQMLEALNVGSIDFASVGETPPIFAQAAGAPIAYVAYEPPAPAAEAILVQKDSPIQNVADLKGKRVALNKGSNVHYLLVRALESAGLNYSDIQPVYLTPGDARPAFDQGKVDAWVIWDPFFAAAQKASGARILVDGKNLVSNHQIYLSTQSYVNQKPEVIKTILEELKTTGEWAKGHSTEVVKFLSEQMGIDQQAIALANQRRDYDVESFTDDVAKEQQKIADTFSNLKLIPKEIKIADAVWKK